MKTQKKDDVFVEKDDNFEGQRMSNHEGFGNEQRFSESGMRQKDGERVYSFSNRECVYTFQTVNRRTQINEGEGNAKQTNGDGR